MQGAAVREMEASQLLRLESWIGWGLIAILCVLRVLLSTRSTLIRGGGGCTNFDVRCKLCR